MEQVLFRHASAERRRCDTDVDCFPDTGLRFRFLRQLSATGAFENKYFKQADRSRRRRYCVAGRAFNDKLDSVSKHMKASKTGARLPN